MARLIVWDSRLVIEGSKRPTRASMEKWTLNGNDDDDDDDVTGLR